ncbi:hypothetical protein O988_06093 [Pseudogymnoascus sp. VKM F-3808]|nr:hypothetical protein O988_06093 [Pseudogymnoascus sp. VKM F-3808]
MDANIDFLQVVQDPNGPFVLCTTCRCVIGVNPHPKSHVDPKKTIHRRQSLLFRHLKTKHSLYKWQIAADLALAWPNIIAALENGRREYPTGQPNGAPKDERLRLHHIYQCQLCSYCRQSKTYTLLHVKTAHKGLKYRVHGYACILAQTYFDYVNSAIGVWWQVDLIPRLPLKPPRTRALNLQQAEAAGEGEEERDPAAAKLPPGRPRTKPRTTDRENLLTKLPTTGRLTSSCACP